MSTPHLLRYLAGTVCQNVIAKLRTKATALLLIQNADSSRKDPHYRMVSDSACKYTFLRRPQLHNEQMCDIAKSNSIPGPDTSDRTFHDNKVNPRLVS